MLFSVCAAEVIPASRDKGAKRPGSLSASFIGAKPK